jgi:hypothetical protein
MSEKPLSGPSYGHGATGVPSSLPLGFPSAQAGSPPWPTSPIRPSRWPSFAALAIALVATGFAIVGWFRPTPTPPGASSSAPTYTEKQVGDAKRIVCDSYALVRAAVSVSTNKQSSGGDAFAARTAIAANGRLALYGGGGYMLEQLSAEPATPSDLANAVKSLAGTFRKLALVDLSEQPESAQTPLRDSVPVATAKIDELCK